MMSDTLGVSAGLAPLPASWYFSQDVADIEKSVLFDAGPGYVGHELMVPNPGDYHSIDWMKDTRLLLRNEQGVELLSNICRHRQATMLEGTGNARNIVCPLHRWTYDLEGKLIGAPHFPENPCLDLGKYPLQNWNGMLFAGKRDIQKDLANFSLFKDLDFSNHVFDRVHIDEYECNWKTFIEVYLEDYHVAPFHPGLNSFVDCDQLSWEFGDWYSVQVVGARYAKVKSGSPVYRNWRDLLLKYDHGREFDRGAIWVVYYPNIMIEWYPHVLVISTVVPRGADRCTNIVEFYYPEDIALFERDLVEAEKAAYLETAVEDAEIIRKMTEGREALHRAGMSESGPYQTPMEDGMKHFHDFLVREISPRL